MIRRATCILLAILMMPWPVIAAPAIPGFYGTLTTPLPQVAPTQLPVLRPGGSIQGLDPSKPYYTVPGTNKAIVNQVQSKAIIDWNEFNIGKDAWVYFDQKDASWAALNRIWDRNPSQIYGRLSAPGTIYLINQNGILFSPTAQVNVHSLIASSLNITSQDFINGVLKFSSKSDEDINGERFYDKSRKPGAVSSHGHIGPATATDALGSIFLIAPVVENSGVMVSPVGQIGLVAATEAEIVRNPAKGARSEPVIYITPDAGGEATNFENGWIVADAGVAGMYGRFVNQDGLIRAVTAVRKAGVIELHASEKVYTGPNSLTYTPVSDSTEAVDQSFVFSGGTVDIGGLMEPYYKGGALDGFSGTSTTRIEHMGAIAAPSGTVNLRATERVYLETGSSIDAGGVWVDRSSDARLMETQLNSVQLKDDYGQKQGLLSGLEISFDSLLGSAIGDVAGSLTTYDVTAREQATKGGSITINAGDGDVIVKEGAAIRFTGGGIYYGAGRMDTTKISSGTKIYDISNAPQYLLYDKLMNLQTKRSQRYGITEEFNGLFTGGANSVADYRGQYVRGSDAGSLTIAARRIVFDGTLDGSVVKGPYQTGLEEKTNKSGNENSDGTEEPRGGMLVLGVAPTGSAAANTQNFGLDEVIIKSSVSALPSGFGPGDAIPSGYGGSGSSSATILSAQTLSNAGLGRLEIYANTTLRIDQGAKISLPSRRYLTDDEKYIYAADGITITGIKEAAKLGGGLFEAAARRIESFGTVSAPGGEINLSLKDNVTSFENIDGTPNPLYKQLDQQRIFLGAGSSLTTAGEQIDNSSVVIGGTVRTGQTKGGTISLLDESLSGEGVIVSSGALVDVSGGWIIDTQSKTTGDDAGILQIGGSASRIEGVAVVLEGTVKGHSLPGNKGGSLILSPLADVLITSASAPALPEGFSEKTPLPESFKNTMVVTDSRFSDTGFANITIESPGNIIVEEEVRFSPSLAKTAFPAMKRSMTNVGEIINNITALGTMDAAGELIYVLPETAGSSSIKLSAGKTLSLGDAAGISLTVQENARLSVFPGGTVSLTGPEVGFAGRIDAPAGTVSLKADYFDVVVKDGSQILAPAYNKPQQTAAMTGYPVGYTTMDGGTVTVQADNGNVILEQRSVIDISGSDPVKTLVKSASGVPEEYVVAGNPGSLTLKYGSALSDNGEIKAGAKMSGVQGGGLTVASTAPAISLTADSISRYLAAGFDDLTFQTVSSLSFAGPIDARIPRRLTLDAPIIYGGDSPVALWSPWMRLVNTYYPTGTAVAAGSAVMTLAGDWIDVQGSVAFSGFSNVTLKAARDMRFSDTFYEPSGLTQTWKGNLDTAGDLVLQAGRIYPTTLSHFTINVGNTVTILPEETSETGPIYSAGGLLEIFAKNIEHLGTLAAPLGQIVLAGGYDSATGSYTQANSIHLAEGSVITTAGSGMVSYGTTDETFWTIPDRTSGSKEATVLVEAAPEKSVTITGDRVATDKGSTIDVSGGGEVFAQLFLASPSGSENPLTKTGRYVIVPGVVLPGSAVYLEGGAGIAAGYYSLLPEEYAFLPNALIITDLAKAGQTYRLGQSVSTEGYPVVTGYSAVMGTGFRSSLPKGYSVRKAEDVRKEGTFVYQSITAGEAGKLTISGTSATVDGTLRMNALPGYTGGTLGLSAQTILIGQDQTSTNALVINPDMFADMDLEELNIGDLAVTNRVTMLGGSVIRGRKVTLSANAGDNPEVILEAGAEIHAVSESGGGEASLNVPGGKVTLKAGSLVHASDRLSLYVNDMDLSGNIMVDHSAIDLKGSRVFFVPEGYEQTEAGLYLTPSRWQMFSAFEEIGIKSMSDILFRGDFDLAASEALTLDAARIAADPSAPGGTNAWTITLTAPIVSLLNTGATSSASTTVDTGTITVNARTLSIGHGAIGFDGFATVNLNSQGDVTFKGKGSLSTGGADLNIATPRVTTSYYEDANTSYEAANFTVDAGDRTVTIQSVAGGTPGTETTPGGRLAIVGSSIEVATKIELPSGQLTMTASDNISLNNGAGLLLQGTADAPAGSVSLKSTGSGSVNIEAGSLIDVSAGAQGDAGSISLYAPTGGVTLAGTIKGDANGGQGGSFAMVTNSITDFSSLNDKLKGSTDGSLSGFNETIDIRTRTGDIVITGTETVKARNVKLTADGGMIDLSGTVDVSYAGRGGTAELYAHGKDVDGTIHGIDVSGTIDARGTGTGATGGDVILATGDSGALNLTGRIDVSGEGAGSGGTVLFRREVTDLPGDNSQLGMQLSGRIAGASSVAAEVDKVYTTYNSITSAVINTIRTDLSGYMTGHAADAKTALLADLRDGDGNPLASGTFHFKTGAVVETAGDLALSSNWDLTSWRFGGDLETGTVTLRAGGNLKINANLVDHPTMIESLRLGLLSSSWGINLVAGADLSSADLMAVRRGSGDLAIASSKVVYSESAPVRFASGNNTVLDASPRSAYMVDSSMPYSLGSYSGEVRGNVGGNLTLDSGSIQTATGDIHIDVAGDLAMNAKTSNLMGSIRTTGHVPSYRDGSNTITAYWLASGGGDITLNIGGAVTGKVNVNSNAKDQAWDSPYSATPGGTKEFWTASYLYSSGGYRTTEGIATMGGGNIDLHAGGNIMAQIGAFGGVGSGIVAPPGDLNIYAGGNIDGRFLITNGTARINAMGSFGTTRIGGAIVNQAIELCDATVYLTARGDVRIGSLTNPVVTHYTTSPAFGDWRLWYDTDSSVTLKAVTGDVALVGDNGFIGRSSYLTQMRERILPPTLEVYAGRDILLSQNFVLAPSSTGNLVLEAGRDIQGGYGKGLRSSIIVSDMDPSEVYGIQSGITAEVANYLFKGDQHAAIPVHTGGSEPIVLQAGRNISNLQLYLPKKALITADQDIRDIYYDGQNVNASDVTVIKAGRDLLFSSSSIGSLKTGIIHGGLGTLIVQAGNNIDLGTTEGIQTVGSGHNYALDAKGATLIVAAGISSEIDAAEMEPLFKQLRDAGSEYARLRNAGDTAGAEQVAEKTRTDILAPFVGEAGSQSGGNINMVQSRISTVASADNIYILARGTVNVGKSTFVTDTERQGTGIYTASGGAINILVGGDLNVNESRVMTYRGGDITVYGLWGYDSEVNAGRGSKTAINVQAPTPKYDWEWIGSRRVLKGVTQTFSPPAVGSGIRTLTYDPDGVTGPLTAPPEGDVYIFAKKIDAGEAGIHGANVFFGATTVLNSQNITFTGTGVGVPAQSQSVSLGALTGTTSMAEKTAVSQDGGALGAAGRQVGGRSQSIEDVLVKWIDLKVISFDPGSGIVGGSDGQDQ